MLSTPLLGTLKTPARLDQRSKALTTVDMLRDATGTTGLRTLEQASNRAHRALPI
jgi:hypothetical protein